MQRIEYAYQRRLILHFTNQNHDRLLIAFFLAYNPHAAQAAGPFLRVQASLNRDAVADRFTRFNLWPLLVSHVQRLHPFRPLGVSILNSQLIMRRDKTDRITHNE